MHLNEPLHLVNEAFEVTREKRRQEKRTLLTRNKAVRKQFKEDDKRKEREKLNKRKRILTVTHQPTYSCLRYKRLDGEKDSKGSPQAFKSKNEIQSVKSQTRIKNAINWLLLFADKKRVHSKKGYADKNGIVRHDFYFRLAFITLTLSDMQKHTDEHLKEKLLQPFLHWISKYYGLFYVWKAETQLNGNIHFHITIDTYIPWQSVRAKWNKLLAKQGYCKVLQDGSNDRGDAATQIKAVCSEKKCANDIGGYMSKKDQIDRNDLKKFKEWLHKGIPIPDSYANASLHCKFNPDIVSTKQDQTWYKRVIDGRLWGCSENLSGITIFLDETFSDFEKEEQIFFRQNSDVYNLGKTVIAREKMKYAKVDEAERAVRGITDEHIEHRYSFMENVFIHPHLSLMKKGGTLQRLIHEEKLKRKKNWQKSFTEN